MKRQTNLIFIILRFKKKFKSVFLIIIQNDKNKNKKPVNLYDNELFMQR